MGGAEFSQIVQLMMEGEEKEEQEIPVPLFLVIRQLIIFGEEALSNPNYPITSDAGIFTNKAMSDSR